MRVMVFVKATEDSEAGAPPPPGLLEAMGKFNEELIAAGVLSTNPRERDFLLTRAAAYG